MGTQTLSTSNGLLSLLQIPLTRAELLFWKGRTWSACANFLVLFERFTACCLKVTSYNLLILVSE
jgi:hypothetical protein